MDFFQETDKTKEAIICYRQAIEIDSKYSIAYTNLSDSLCQLKEYEEAVHLLEDALVKFPNNAWIQLHKGNTL